MEQSSLFKLKDGRYFLDENQSVIYSKIVNAHPQYSSEYKWNEMSMADLFADCYRHNTLFCPEMKSWYVYNGQIWVKDTGNVIVNDRLKEFVKLLTIYANELDDGEVKADDYRKFVIKLVDRRVRDRIIKDAQTEACVYLNQFDRFPNYINCENGTYDLDTDTFHEHRAEDYLTLMTNCVYAIETANYKCDRWFQFLDEIMEGDKEKLEYIHRALGYSLYGLPNEECMFFAYGKTTRNGKGTLFNTVQSILGDYATTVSSQLICFNGTSKNVNDANPVVCSLKGKRFVIMSEVKQNATVDAEIIKSFTGNDNISTRALYGEQFNMKLQCTFFLMCNTLPKITDRSFFSSDRGKVIEFTRHFNDQERDTSLKQQFLTKEAKAVIFKWLIDGYKLYKMKKLSEPECVKKAIENYEDSNDLVKVFINECCEDDGLSKTMRTEIYEAFDEWRKKGDYPRLTKVQFYEGMDARYERSHLNGYLYYKGVKLKNSLI